MFLEDYGLVVAMLIIGFLIALLLAAGVLILIAYCMFFKERLKTKLNHYDVSDLKHENIMIAQKHQMAKDKESKGLAVTAGVLILPSRRRKHEDKDVYEQRPDYPESSAMNVETGTTDMIQAFTEFVNDNAVHENDNIMNVNDNCNVETDFGSQYHSEV